MWGWVMSVRARLLSTTTLSGVVGAIFLSSLSAHAADLITKAPVGGRVALQPGVDGTNWKFDALGGVMSDRTIYGGRGSFSVPLGGQLGFQLDGAFGNYDSRFFGAGAAHLFWRDPSRGLVGLYGSHTYWDQFGGLNVSQIAGEAEVYMGPFTLRGIAGVEFGDSQTQVTGTVVSVNSVTTFFDTYDVETRFFDKVNLSYYLNDSVQVFAGHRYLGGKHALALGGEVGFSRGGPLMGAAFVEARIGENDFDGIWGGLRAYIGEKDKSLIQRHRQDDPFNWLPETLFSITNSLTKSTTTTIINPPDADGDTDGDGDN